MSLVRRYFFKIFSLKDWIEIYMVRDKYSSSITPTYMYKTQRPVQKIKKKNKRNRKRKKGRTSK